MEIVRVDGLEVDQDLAFQRRSWVVQRVGWGLMALVVLAAVAGLLGSGPLSNARAEVPGLMTLEYHRFARLDTGETLRLSLRPAATAGDTVRLSLTQAFLGAVRIETVQPPPARVEVGDGRLVYVFPVAEPRVPMVVTFAYQPREVGAAHGVVGLESTPEPRHVAFRQLVYP